MQPKIGLMALVAARSGFADTRPSSQSVCDYYTQVIFGSDSAEAQFKLITKLVNTVIIGSYSPNPLVNVPGILFKDTFEGVDVDLTPYFDGTLESTNNGGMTGVSKNFLDGGGVDPLKQDKPAFDTTSNQYFLLTHLYTFFGALLKCSAYGNAPDFPAYNGQHSMYKVHAFMDLNNKQVGYFIQQVALAAESFGVSADDVLSIRQALGATFGTRCNPPADIGFGTTDLQSICVDGNCETSSAPVCEQYGSVFAPRNTKTGNNDTAPGSQGGVPNKDNSGMNAGNSSTTTTGGGTMRMDGTTTTTGTTTQGTNNGMTDGSGMTMGAGGGSDNNNNGMTMTLPGGGGSMTMGVGIGGGSGSTTTGAASKPTATKAMAGAAGLGWDLAAGAGALVAFAFAI